MPADRLLRKIRAASQRHHLWRPGDHLLAAVSGGADSVALLLALCALAPAQRLRVTAAHLDHRLRGAAAERDARFVAALARRLGVPLLSARRDVPRLARRQGLSLEMAARTARYRFLAQAARRAGAAAVATGHTADDQAETLLLKLARGTGMRGLAGIPPETLRHGVRIVRPLLEATRAEVLAFLRRRKAAWREDASNRADALLRNRVRHEVLPLLEHRLNPRVREALRRTAEVLRAEDAWLDALSRASLASCRASPPSGRGSRARLLAAALRDLPLAARRRAIRLWLAECGLPAEQITFEDAERIARLLSRPGGTARIPLARRWEVIRRYGELAVRPRAPRPAAAGLAPRPLKVPGVTRLPRAGLRICVACARGVLKPRGARIGRWPAEASLLRAALGRRRLSVRSWQPGDRIRPLGLRGSQKLQDVFVNAKVPAELRAGVPLVVCGKEIVWVPGYRIASGWEVRPEDAAALHLRVEPLDPAAGRRYYKVEGS